MPEPEVEPLIQSRDDIRREALSVQRMHDPKQQVDNGYNRCMHCHYTSHPCDAYDMATTVLMLIDQGQPDEYYT
jgi:hypothetical protein